jgi:hypothetical protein
MTQAIRELERDIAETRARLDDTIDRLQDRLSVPGVVDGVLGTMRASRRFGALFDDAIAVVRRNPAPVILIAAGVGWLVHRLSQEGRPLSSRDRTIDVEDAGVPVLNIGHARLYDPDTSPLHPTQDSLESRREMSAQA